MVNQLFTAFGEIIGNVGDLFKSLFDTAVGIVYNSADGITEIGYLFIIGACVGLFYFGLRWLRSLIQLRG